MFCRHCQTIIPDDSLFCENCGAPTGLNPEQIDDSNLVPEEAVEFEVTKDEEPIETTSVPVDPIWWEPPEEEDEPIDVEIAPVFEEDWMEAEELPKGADGFASDGYDGKPEAPDSEAGSEETASWAEEASDAGRFAGASDGSFAAETEGAEDDGKPVGEIAGEVLHGLATGIMGFGRSLKKKIEEELEPEEEPEETWEQPQEGTREETWEKPWEEPAAEEQETWEEPAAEEPEVREEPAVEAFVWKSGLDAVQDWEPAPSGEPEDADALEVPDFMKTEEPEAESKEEPAKPYAFKAKGLLAGLGKNVHTGTGWAVGAAKEQFQQRKEEFTERREQREQQREQEKKEKERERQKELERLQEEERRAKEIVIQQPGFWYGDKMPEPTIAFAPAVKAGDDHEESAPEDLSEQAETAEQSEEYAPETVEIPTAAETSHETDLLRTPAFETLRGMAEEEEPQEPSEPVQETLSGQEPLQGPSSRQEPLQGPEPLSEEEIEDKLAETTRFDWSKGELEAAVAAAAAAANGADSSETNDGTDSSGGADGTDPSDTAGLTDNADASDNIDRVDITDFAAITDPSIIIDSADTDDTDSSGTAEEERTVIPVFDPDQPASIVEEDVPPDEPALYRIQDFGPVTGSKKLTIKERNTPERKDIIKIAAVIVAVLLAIGIVAGVMIHQAHVRQLEEEAYQANLAQAHELVEHQKYKKAEKAYLALIDERPDDPEPYLGLANMYIEQQRYVDAKALVKRAVEATGDEEAFAQTKKELKILTSRKWKKAYIKVLEEYESEIRSYEEDVTASVAVCDVNGDRRPELFFFTKEYYGYGKLHIYTTVSGKAKEVDYECKNRGTQYHDAFYDVSANDSSYAIFNGSGKGEFQIYANVGSGGRSWDTTNEYKLNLKGGCKQLKVIEGSVDTTYGEGDVDNSEYLLDDESITYDKYIAEFRAVLDGVQQVILYNGSGGDQAVWEKIKPDNVMCMTYDAMMVDLKAK